MKWVVTDEYSAYYPCISVIGTDFFVPVYFVVCLVLVFFGVMRSMLLYELVGSKILQVL